MNNFYPNSETLGLTYNSLQAFATVNYLRTCWHLFSEGYVKLRFRRNEIFIKAIVPRIRNYFTKIKSLSLAFPPKLPMAILHTRAPRLNQPKDIFFYYA